MEYSLINRRKRAKEIKEKLLSLLKNGAIKLVLSLLADALRGDPDSEEEFLSEYLEVILQEFRINRLDNNSSSLSQKDQETERLKIVDGLMRFVNTELEPKHLLKLNTSIDIDYKEFNQTSIEERFLWLAVREINTIESLRYYLEKYPNGVFVEETIQLLEYFNKNFHTEYPFINIQLQDGWQKELLARYAPTGIESVSNLLEDVEKTLRTEFNGFAKKLKTTRVRLVDRRTELVLAESEQFDARTFTSKEWKVFLFDPKIHIVIDGRIINKNSYENQIAIREEFNKRFPDAKEVVNQSNKQLEALRGLQKNEGQVRKFTNKLRAAFIPKKYSDSTDAQKSYVNYVILHSTAYLTILGYSLALAFHVGAKWTPLDTIRTINLSIITPPLAVLFIIYHDLIRPEISPLGGKGFSTSYFNRTGIIRLFFIFYSLTIIFLLLIWDTINASLMELAPLDRAILIAFYTPAVISWKIIFYILIWYYFIRKEKITENSNQ